MTILFLFLLNSITLFAQSKAEINQKTNEILAEANRLYRYEQTAWLGTDQAMIMENIRPDFEGYLVYESGDSIKILILNAAQQCILEIAYTDDFTKAAFQSDKKRDLSTREKELMKIKNTIISQIGKKKYEVGCPQGYNLNAVLIPDGKLYKLYVVTGTSRENVIPFGNDYLFTANIKGKITDFKKFHSRLIPAPTKYGDTKILSLSHSHLRSTPYITATDICTFRLYAPLYGLESFSVYSPALSATFTYTLETNKIDIAFRNK
jgi:hypothetical protein